jgi:hypothetical protein
MLNHQQLAQEHHQQRKSYDLYAKRRFYRALREMVTPVLVDNKLQVQSDPMQRAYEDVYAFVGIDSARREFLAIKKREATVKADIGIQLLLNTWNLWIRSYVQANLAQMIRDVTQNTQDKINEALQESLSKGLTRRQTAELIYQKTLGEIGRRRASLIGITESTTASNIGKLKSGKDYGQLIGVEMYKKWLNVSRPTERHTHEFQNEAPPISEYQPFHVINEATGGVNLMFTPGDLTAPASQRCNCACTMILMSKRFAERNYSL